ncbi:hypothetical protein HanIR_Chr13g0653481 [Helianthus annuus]|nr:hypothetical protein HanIR_Chr13g0653481 [Helianthus annuus]
MKEGGCWLGSFSEWGPKECWFNIEPPWLLRARAHSNGWSTPV